MERGGRMGIKTGDIEKHISVARARERERGEKSRDKERLDGQSLVRITRKKQPWRMPTATKSSQQREGKLGGISICF